MARTRRGVGHSAATPPSSSASLSTARLALATAFPASAHPHASITHSGIHQLPPDVIVDSDDEGIDGLLRFVSGDTLLGSGGQLDSGDFRCVWVLMTVTRAFWPSTLSYAIGKQIHEWGSGSSLRISGCALYATYLVQTSIIPPCILINAPHASTHHLHATSTMQTLHACMPREWLQITSARAG